MSENAETGTDLSIGHVPLPLPEVSHPTDRPNFCLVTVADTAYWFSYHTCIAFCRRGRDVVVRENNWGPTTGKHLAYIDGGGLAKQDRLSSEAFELALEDARLSLRGVS